jgi:hypothetical protein
MLTNRYLVVVALLTLSGCPTKNSDPEPDAGAAGVGGVAGTGEIGGQGGVAPAAGAAGSVAGAAGTESAKLPAPDAGTANVGGKPIGVGCATNAECATGFCVDSMCCNTSCDGQCQSCNASGNEGYCTPQLVGDDTTSSESCTGAFTCSFSVPGVPLFDYPYCRLKNLQACKADSDCSSLLCQTFYVDHDGDGYGDSNRTISFCEPTTEATPPAGYSAVGGDCCDSDNNTFPGQTKYFTVANVCGGWDYNCDGVIEANTGLYKETLSDSSSCGVVPPRSSAPLSCQ